MDESFHELESELKTLQLRRPSPQLVERLSADLSTNMESPALPRPHYTTATNLGSWKWLGRRPAGLAAAVALLATLGVISFRRQSSPSAGIPPAQLAAITPEPAQSGSGSLASRDRYQPVAATNVLYDLQDGGLVKGEDDAPTRRVRARYLDTYTWKNPATNASLKWSVPRDEIRLLSTVLN